MESHAKQIWSGWSSPIVAAAAILPLAAPVFLVLMTVPRLGAQAQAAPAAKPQSLEAMEAAGVKMSFDVVSVKPSNPAGRPYANLSRAPGAVLTPTGGLFSATNLPLVSYVWLAYDLSSDEALKVRDQFPAWAKTDLFDIEARAQGNPGNAEMRLMMQSMLADRFKLEVHFETKDGPIFALVLVKPGKTGPQLTPHADDPSCSALPASPPGTEQAGANASACASTGIGGSRTSVPGRIGLGGRGITLENIAKTLPYTSLYGSGIDRTVVDRTGLSGKFDWSIEFTPDLPPGTGGNFKPDDTGPTFLEAMRDQLGLKLDAATGPVRVLIIDHVQEPSPN
jgi:uncharacterized protein (TIGR03435 family)